MLERVSGIEPERANILGKYLDLELERYWNSFKRRPKQEGHIQILNAVCEKAKKDQGLDLTPQEALINFMDWYAVNARKRVEIAMVFGELYGVGKINPVE